MNIIDDAFTRVIGCGDMAMVGSVGFLDSRFGGLSNLEVRCEAVVAIRKNFLEKANNCAGIPHPAGKKKKYQTV